MDQLLGDVVPALPGGDADPARHATTKYADDGLALVAISVQETTADDVRAYVERYDLDYTVGFDATSAIFHTYHAYGLPTQLFLDRRRRDPKRDARADHREDADESISGAATQPEPAPSAPTS